jgi:hypothetical protein
LPLSALEINMLIFRGEDLKKLVNQKQELLVEAMFVHESGRN